MATAAQPIFSVHASADEVELGQEIEFSIQRSAEGTLDVASAVHWRVVQPPAGEPLLIDMDQRVSNFDPYDQVRTGTFQTRADPAVAGGGKVTVELFDAMGGTIDPEFRTASTYVTVSQGPSDEQFVRVREITTELTQGTAAVTQITIIASGPAGVIDVGNAEPKGAGATSILSPVLTQFMPATGFYAKAGYDYVVGLDEDPDVRATGRIHIVPKTTVEPDPGPDPAPPPTGDIPKALREIKVSNGGELSKALASVDPGTHLIVQPGGDYSGIYTMPAGTRGAPIFVRGEPGRPVRFVGQIRMAKPWNGAAWLEFAGSGKKVDISAQGGRVTRSRFASTNCDGMIYLTGYGHPDWRVDHCDFVDIRGAAVRCELYGDTRNHRGGSFDHNHVDGHTCAGDNESVLLIQQDEWSDIDMTIADNLFENCLRGATDQREVVKAATAGTSFLRNTILNSNRGYISLRAAGKCKATGNWLEDGSYINVYGDDHVIQNNRSTGVVAMLQRGNCYSSSTVPKGCSGAPKAGKCTLTSNCNPGWAGARRALLEHNIGEIRLGSVKSSRDKGTHPPQDITLRNNASQAKVDTDPIKGLSESGVGEHTNTARKISAKDVGVGAD